MVVFLFMDIDEVSRHYLFRQNERTLYVAQAQTPFDFEEAVFFHVMDLPCVCTDMTMAHLLFWSEPAKALEILSNVMPRAGRRPDLRLRVLRGDGDEKRYEVAEEIALPNTDPSNSSAG